MIASIIPLKRLPRPLDRFDYEVPIELREKITVGQLVTIPFRQSIVYGLIFSLAKTTARANQTELKSLGDIVQQTPLVSADQLEFFLTLSQWYGVALGTIAMMGVLPLQKRKLGRLQLSDFGLPAPPLKAAANKPTFHLYKNSDEHQQALLSAVSDATLILVPEVCLIDEVLSLLSPEQQIQTIAWHSALSAKDQFERWLQIRNGGKTIVIGTRGAIFLPFPTLNAIIIDYEHDENHKHWDQAPRFHVKDVASLLMNQHHAKLHLMSFSPSCESYFHVHKGNYIATAEALRFFPTESGETKGGSQGSATSGFKIIDLLEERRARRFGILADKVEEHIGRATEDIVIFVSRRGFATSIGCNNCGYTAICQLCQQTLTYHDDATLRCHYCSTATPLPTSCPTCRASMVQLRGAGSEAVEKYVRDLFGSDNRYDILRMDSDANTPPIHDAARPRVLIGTEMILPFIRWAKTELIILADIDHYLHLPDWRARERVWHLLREIAYRRKAGAAAYIQTREHDHLLFRSLKEPDRWYRTELNGRQKFLYPPYTYLVRYFIGANSSDSAKSAALLLQAELTDALTEAKKSITINLPLDMQPAFYRKQYWQVLIAKLPVATWQTDLRWLNERIPSTWKIDPNPISLLSP